VSIYVAYIYVAYIYVAYIYVAYIYVAYIYVACIYVAYYRPLSPQHSEDGHRPACSCCTSVEGHVDADVRAAQGIGVCGAVHRTVRRYRCVCLLRTKPIEIEKFIIRQPPTGEKDDYDSENSWISDGLPSSSRRRRRGDGRWEVGEWREK